MADHAGDGTVLLGLHVLPIVLFASLLALDLGERRGVPVARRMLRGLRRLSPSLRLALLLVLVSAAIHLSLVPGHLGQPPTASLFVLDATAEAALCLMACCGIRGWSRLGAVLMVANLAAYTSYVMAGLERPGAVGVATKLVELLALALFTLSARQSFVVRSMKKVATS
jgi:hypothetical protein